MAKKVKKRAPRKYKESSLIIYYKFVIYIVLVVILSAFLVTLFIPAAVSFKEVLGISTSSAEVTR